MKRVLGIVAVVILMMVPSVVMAEEYDMSLSAICVSESVEVGDQFLVTIEKSEPNLKFLTFRVNGAFDSEFAEVLAPVYTNEVLGILTNNFDNENGTFTFEGYDQTIQGTDENIVCAILFIAKKSGNFTLSLDGCMLGKHNENAFYRLNCENMSLNISDDKDGKEVVIIEDEKPKTPYDEIIMGHRAERDIAVMYQIGALKDIADETIEPDRFITRGEFAVMLQRVCKIKSSASVEPFSDIEDGSYMFAPINVLKAKNLAKGDGEGAFMANDEITREDMFSLIFRTMISMNKVDSKIDSEKYLADFSDKDEIAPYASDAFAGVLRAKLWETDDAMCEPTKKVTVGEACTILNKLAEFNILVSRN